ncbi:MAG TPA: VOC family protein [Povalibacter sp.]
MKANRSMPASIVIPVLAYPDVRAAVGWLCAAFGFVERLRIGDHRAQLELDGGAIVVARGSSDTAAKVSSHSIMVRVADVNAHYEHSTRSGVATGGAPADYPYGERQYSAVDLAGNVWTFSQTLDDVDPANWGGQLLRNL